MSNSKKISQLTTVTTLADADKFTAVVNGQNVNISFANTKAALGVTGTLTATGDLLNLPVLFSPVSGDYRIRGMENGPGVSFSITPDNGIKATWNVTQDSTGVSLTSGLTTDPVISSLVAGTRTTLTKTDDAITIDVDAIDGVDTANAGEVYVADGAGSANWSNVDDISSGTAPAGSMLVADGSGGADFIRVQGWSQYQDSRRTVGTPALTLSPGVKTKLVCNGGFLTTNKLPSDAITPLWNTATNKMTPISEFDVYDIRIGFWAENYGGTNPYVEFALDIGSPIGEIVWRDISLRKSGATVKSSAAFHVFTGSTFLANGGEFYLTYQGTGTCDIYAIDVFVVRVSKNYV